MDERLESLLIVFFLVIVILYAVYHTGIGRKYILGSTT